MMSPAELVTRAEAVIGSLRSLLTKEREAVLAFDANAIATCAAEKTALVQEMWLISAQLRKEMMKEEHLADSKLQLEVRAYREAVVDVRRLLGRNERLIQFAQELTQTVLAAQRPSEVRYDAGGQVRAATPALFHRRA